MALILALSGAAVAQRVDDTAMLRSGGLWRVRPQWVASVGPDRLRSGLGLGLTLGHRWWSMNRTGVRVSGANQLQLEGSVGGARSLRATALADATAWFGPVGLRAGPRLDLHRMRSDDVQEPFALRIGPEVGVGLATRDVSVSAGWAPQWPLARLGTPEVDLTPSSTWTVALSVGRVLQPQLEGRLVTGLPSGPQLTTFLGLRLSFADAIDSGEDS